MEKMPIFALSSNSNERSRFERLSTPVGFFYAPVRPICGSVTPCRSRNARQLVGSLTAGSAEPLFVFSTQPVIVIKLCQNPTTIAGRRAIGAPPAAWTQSSHFRQPTPSVLFTADLSWKYRTESFSETTLPLLAIKVNDILSKWQVQVFLDQSDALEEVAEAFRTVCETNSNLIDLYVGRNVSR